MKKSTLLLLIGTVLIIILAIIFGRPKSKKEYNTQNPEIHNYISSYSSGIISSKSSIKVRLVDDIDSAKAATVITGNLFSFEPTIDGEARWIDSRTIEFIPNEKLPSGEFYNVELKLSKLIDVPASFKDFKFAFQIIKQNLELSFDKISNYNSKDLKWQIVEGAVLAADVIEIADLEEAFSANLNNEKFAIKFRNTSSPKIYEFRIDSVPRTDEDAMLYINCIGNNLGFDQNNTFNFAIPDINNFKIIQAKVTQQPNQYLSIIFSDPIDLEQSIKGFALIDNKNVKITIEGNTLKVFPLRRLIGNHKLTVFKGIKNSIGIKTKEDKEINIQFDEIKPNVELLGKGVIFPNSEGVNFPFRAVNLRAVDVKIIRIYEDNIAQFFQVNHFDQSREIERVGRVVYKKSIDLKSKEAIDYGVWNTFALQLDKLIETTPGAIYRVIISFNRSQSLYHCIDADSVDLEMKSTDNDNWNEDNSDEYSSWDYFEDNYSSYNYQDRNNPCKDSYYRYKNVARNVFASDLGIIAKEGNDKVLHIAITELSTTIPMESVSVKVMNFQQQQIAEGVTDSQGLLELNVRSKAYFLIANKNKQYGYMRLDNNSSLSLSKFDVSGSVIQKGIKGFIYGERGVWRPGDTLFLGFILQEKSGMLSDNQPIKFELINPNGQIVKSATKNKSVGGIYTFITKTDQEDITGNYTLRVRFGGAIFTKRLRIETFKPNRLKINFDFGKEEISIADKNLSAKLYAKWLHGAIAKNLKADVNVIFTARKTTFKGYGDYNFDDPTKSFSSQEQMVFEGKLDDQGNAKVAISLDPNEDAPGMLKAHFKTRVFEEGGGFSIDKFSIPYSPYSTYVGVKLPKGDKTRGMLLTDIDHKIEVAAVNSIGKAVDTKVKVEVYKIEWSWWWQKNGGDNLAKYVGSSYYQPLSTSVINTKKGFGSATLNIKYPDWGRYLVRVSDENGEHSTAKVVYIDWPGWAGRATKDNPGGASMLSFTTDKTDYNVGEDVKLSFPSSKGGRALVSVENGSKVISTFWVDAEDKTTNFTFTANSDMSPNVYVNITLIQPHNFTKNDLPIRLYGIVPIRVTDPNTKLYPKIKMAEVLRPNQKVDIEVSEDNGKAMSYTIAVVDEGILDVTRFKTPDPWSNFNAREALGVRSWDMYEYVMGAYAGEISGLLEIGGDGDLINKGTKKANRFKPVVKFLGPFTLEAGAKNINSFIMPQYVGSVRTMVIAVADNAYGNTDETTVVKEDLMVLATMPRVVGPTEKVVLPVTVFSMDKSIKNVSIEIKTNDLLIIDGAKSKKIKFRKIGDKVVNFDLLVASKIGIATVEVIAKSGSNIAKYEIELDVRNPNPAIVEVSENIINNNKSWKTNLNKIGIDGTNSAYIEISSIPSIDLENRLQYLIKYPHGCIEQTTSSVFPQLFLSDFVKLDAGKKNRIRSNITQALNKFISFQNADGSFSYWPGKTDANDWGTSYAGHFMIEAKNKAYVLPSGMLNKWVNYQKNKANNWRESDSYSNSLLQAYRLYTLAIANKAEMGAMNRLKENTKLSTQAKWRLAAAYARAGYKDIAKEILMNTNAEIVKTQYQSSSYGSNIRDKAMILETMLLLDMNVESVRLLKEISKRLNSGEWMSTQTTAYSLVAISKYISKNSVGSSISYSVKFNNAKALKQETLKPISKIDFKNIQENNSIEIINDGNNVLFAKLVSKGVPAIGENKGAQNNLNISVKYYSLDGKKIDPKNIIQGTDFKVEVTLFNPGMRGDYKDMALSQIFPSGWEIHNTRMDDMESSHTKSTPDYMDIRDDRVYYYFDLNKGKSKTFVSILNASFIGKFYLPSVYCESMYDNSISASTEGIWVDVVE